MSNMVKILVLSLSLTGCFSPVDRTLLHMEKNEALTFELLPGSCKQESGTFPESPVFAEEQTVVYLCSNYRLFKVTRHALQNPM